MVRQSPTSQGTKLVFCGGRDAREVDGWKEWILFDTLFGFEVEVAVVIGRDGCG